MKEHQKMTETENQPVLENKSSKMSGQAGQVIFKKKRKVNKKKEKKPK
jgi:hypothetical protein